MTPAMLSLLKRMIQADRDYHSAKARRDEFYTMDWRGVEVGAINGVNPRTAEALVEMGLGEIVNLHGNNGFIFLGKYQPYDEPEKVD